LLDANSLLPVQEEYRGLKALLTTNVAVIQTLHENRAAAAQSASEALNLLKDHRKESQSTSPSQLVGAPVWKKGPPRQVPESFAANNSDQEGSVRTVLNRALKETQGKRKSNKNGVRNNAKGEALSESKVSPARKILEAAVRDMDACAELSLRSEAGRKMLEVRRAAWEVQMSCMKGKQ
jgi:hypothetical protein